MTLRALLPIVAISTAMVSAAYAAPRTIKAKGATLCGMIANDVYSVEEVKAKVAARARAFDACYEGTDVDPYSRGFQVYVVQVTPQGRAESVTFAATPGPHDACMIPAIGNTPFGRPANGEGGEIRLHFAARFR
jgi:hypothetical protein